VQCDILALDTLGRTRPADMKATTNPPEAKGLRPSTSRWLAIAIAAGVLITRRSWWQLTMHPSARAPVS